MSTAELLSSVPEAIRLALYPRCVDDGLRLTALVSATLPVGATATKLEDGVQALSGVSWTISVAATASAGLRVLALVQGEPKAVAQQLSTLGIGVGVDCELEDVEARALVLPSGEASTSSQLDTASFERAIVHHDGVALYKAAVAELEIAAPDSFRASTLRWLLCALETSHPDEALVRALIAAAQSGKLELGASQRAQASGRDPSEQSRVRAHAIDLLSAQLDLMAVPCDNALVTGRLHAVATVIERVLPALGHKELAATVPEALRDALHVGSAEPLRRVIRTALPQRSVERAPAEEGLAALPEIARSRELKQLKVDPARIDALMALTGELVVAKNALPYLAGRAEQGLSSKQLARDLKEHYQVVNRISEELQTAVMRVRMVPLSHVFRRFPRLVRDVSERLGKNIELVLRGEDTEADKDIVEDLFDPLMHLMRNAIDHGVEAPPERIAAGKPEVATIELSAVQREDEIEIVLRDDGKGMDPAWIRRKALQRGVIEAAAAEALSDQESLDLVFIAGFSTAESISDLSGRGVGMDVVRSMVQRARGTLRLESKIGEGTSVRIRLPLSMAVNQLMMLEAGGTVFGIPFANVVETLRVPKEELRRLGVEEAIVLRNRLVPVLRLPTLLGMKAHKDSHSDLVSMLVVQTEEHELALVVDKLYSGIDAIVKPLAGVMANCHTFSGTALLGDGRVLLVINLKELLSNGGRAEA